MSSTLQLAAAAGGGAALLVGAAAVLLSGEAGERDVAYRLRQVLRTAPATAPDAGARGRLFDAAWKVGSFAQKATLFSSGNAADLERTALAAGLDPRRVVPLVMGAKILLMLCLPVVGYGLGWFFDLSPTKRLLPAVIGIVIGMIGPNWVLDRARSLNAAALKRGLPDALDLLVVCAEAGLGLETAVDRVAAEMMAFNKATAQVFLNLAQEMRMSSDRGAALVNMGERTGLESFRRMTGTLSQTLRYGTPLGHALRLLAGEMRDERMMKLEENAAKLPSLLTLPMMVFIFPSQFIVLVGPAAINILNSFGN